MVVVLSPSLGRQNPLMQPPRQPTEPYVSGEWVAVVTTLGGSFCDLHEKVITYGMV